MTQLAIDSKAIVAFAIWLAIRGVLGGGIADALSFAVGVGLCFIVGYAVLS